MAEYLAMTADQRLKALRETLGQSLQAVTRAAEIYQAMITAGDDVKVIPRHLRRMLVRVASGTMLPETTQLAGRLRQRVGRLPLPDQRRVVTGQVVDVLLDDGATVSIDPRDMDPQQVMQVLDDNGIRTIDQQRAWQLMRSRSAPRRPGERAYRSRRCKIEIDREHNGAIINDVFVSRARLLKIIGEL